MKIELKEDQALKVIKNYYKEVEGTDINACFKRNEVEKDLNVTLMSYSYVEFAGMNFKVEEEIDNNKIEEIVNYYLSADYNFKELSFSLYKEYYRPDDYAERVKMVIEFEPVIQKTKQRLR